MHLSWEELVDYWADEHADAESDTRPEVEALELHTMSCDVCAQLSARIAAIARALPGLLPPLLSAELLAKLPARGLHVSETALQPGERREVFFPAEVDVLVMRLEGLPPELARLDFQMAQEGTGAPFVQLQDVPFAHGAALLACQQHYASLPPDVVVTLHATDKAGQRSEHRYTILHRFERAAQNLP